MVRAGGFEPPTAWFVARYSIQLSYARTVFLLGKIFLLAIKRNNAVVKPYLAVIIDNSKRMAVKEGFEPSIRDKPYTPLAGERLQPLGHLTTQIGVNNKFTTYHSK